MKKNGTTLTGFFNSFLFFFGIFVNEEKLQKLIGNKPKDDVKSVCFRGPVCLLANVKIYTTFDDKMVERINLQRCSCLH